jgi:hypothetical protein
MDRTLTSCVRGASTIWNGRGLKIGLQYCSTFQVYNATIIVIQSTTVAIVTVRITLLVLQQI